MLPTGNGPPQPVSSLTFAQKFDYRIIKTFALRGFVGAALGAAISQSLDVPKEWGQDFPGYVQRYGSAFSTAFSRQTVDLAFEAVLREDPRYFPSEKKSTKARVWSALIQTFICRTDSGKDSFAYGRVASAFATGQIANLWQPKSNNSVGDGLERGGIGLGVDAAVNLLYEFVPRSRVQEYYPHP